MTVPILMPSWYYEKKDLKRSPSIIDGLDMERESRYRREGARFIINVGTKMGLRYDTMATGVVYFHRFYMFHSFKTFPRFVTACCCLFLAGKVEETPKKCKDIIRIAKTYIADSQFSQFGDDPKEEVMILERILLQTIKFDLQVDHPYGHLIRYAKSLKGDKAKLQNMVQMAWTFINDSLCTTLCLQFEPEVIAIALMYLAGKLSKFDVVDWLGRTSRHSHWWDMFVEGMSIELLEDICHQVLDLYSTPMSNTPLDSPPATPPSKSTRKTSQPPSPIETSTSPAQTVNQKPALVGMPIPRLEPGELKRKVSQSEPKKEMPDTKFPRILEGKPITTITSSPKACSSQGSDTQPSSPTSPDLPDTSVKVLKHPDMNMSRKTAEPMYRHTVSQSYTQSASEGLPPLVAPPAQVNTYAPAVPPPAVSYTQSTSFYTGVAQDTQQFSIQPPPPIYPPRMQFQHPPPPVAPTPPPIPLPNIHRPPLPPQYSEPQHTYSSNVPPPYNSQYPPPPRHQQPIMSTPPPGPPPPGHPPPGMPPPMTSSGLLVPPPLRNPPPPRIPPDSHYGTRPEMYQDRSRLQPDHREYRGHYKAESQQQFRGQRNTEFDQYDEYDEFDESYEYDEPYHNQPTVQYEQEYEGPRLPRRYSQEQQTHRKHERGPPPNMAQQQGANPTGIPPVRITGSMPSRL